MVPVHRAAAACRDQDVLFHADLSPSSAAPASPSFWATRALIRSGSTLVSCPAHRALRPLKQFFITDAPFFKILFQFAPAPEQPGAHRGAWHAQLPGDLLGAAPLLVVQAEDRLIGFAQLPQRLGQQRPLLPLEHRPGGGIRPGQHHVLQILLRRARARSQLLAWLRAMAAR